ncbi:MAG: hypothetical protein JWR44_3084 [Hymenobacter sp.]|jgi:hypothetical protein|nr:hypothetical protein [Hymenobacter sp.]
MLSEVEASRVLERTTRQDYYHTRDASTSLSMTFFLLLYFNPRSYLLNRTVP